MWRLRKSVKKKIVVGVLLVAVQLLFFVVCQATVRYITEQNYRTVLEEKDARLQAAGRIVYITLREIKAGEVFTEENVQRQYLLSEQNPKALAEAVIGSTACANLQEGEIITSSVCTEKLFSPSERRCVFYNIKYAGSFAQYDTVDVRIRYANGENYCVIKKKYLQKSTDDTEACFFFLTEEEQLLMSAAQYDTELYDGAELYMVGFMEERLQEDAISAYLPPLQVISQLRTWETGYAEAFEEWCKLRSALEERLLKYRELRREGLL